MTLGFIVLIREHGDRWDPSWDGELHDRVDAEFELRSALEGGYEACLAEVRQVRARLEHRCSACWQGQSSRDVTNSGEDCDACGLPGPKPADYEWPPGSGRWVTHYLNHGGTWQSAPGDAVTTAPEEARDA